VHDDNEVLYVLLTLRLDVIFAIFAS